MGERPHIGHTKFLAVGASALGQKLWILHHRDAANIGSFARFIVQTLFESTQPQGKSEIRKENLLEP